MGLLRSPPQQQANSVQPRSSPAPSQSPRRASPQVTKPFVSAIPVPVSNSSTASTASLVPANHADLTQLQNDNANLTAHVARCQRACNSYLEQMDGLEADHRQQKEALLQDIQTIKSEHQAAFNKATAMQKAEIDNLKKGHALEMSELKARLEQVATQGDQVQNLNNEFELHKAATKERTQQLQLKELELEYERDRVLELEADLRMHERRSDEATEDIVLQVLMSSEAERRTKVELIAVQNKLLRLSEKHAKLQTKHQTTIQKEAKSAANRTADLEKSLATSTKQLKESDGARKKAEQKIRELNMEIQLLQSAAVLSPKSKGKKQEKEIDHEKYDELLVELKCTRKEVKVAEKKLVEAREELFEVKKQRDVLNLEAKTLMKDYEKLEREIEELQPASRKLSDQAAKLKKPVPAPKSKPVAPVSAEESSNHETANPKKRKALQASGSAAIPLPDLSPAKKRRIEIDLSESDFNASSEKEEAPPPPKKRGRPPKVLPEGQVKRGRGRPRKYPLPGSEPSAAVSLPEVPGASQEVSKPKAKPKKITTLAELMQTGADEETSSTHSRKGTEAGEKRKAAKPKEAVVQAQQEEEVSEEEIAEPDEVEVQVPTVEVTKKKAIKAKPVAKPPSVKVPVQESEEGDVEEQQEEAEQPREVVANPPKRGRGRPPKLKNLQKAEPATKAKAAEPKRTLQRVASAASILEEEKSHSPEPDLLKTKKKKIKLGGNSGASIEKWAKSWEMQGDGLLDLPNHLSPVKGAKK